jgi:IS5 family transposase
MRGKSPDQNQLNLFKPVLKQLINPKNELVILADIYPWKELEDEFSSLYSHTGIHSKPVRLMAGLLMLKQMFNLGDETVVEAWIQNPYYQYFCGESEFQWHFPCDPSDLVHFRKRIGKNGFEKIFELSVKIQGKQELNKRDVIIDTTVQEKDITFPTDVKLYKKIIERCNKIAKDEGLELRQSYTKTLKRLMLQQRFSHHPKRRKEAGKSKRKMRTIAGRLTRELDRKLNDDQKQEYGELLNIFYQIISQKPKDKNKIYSIHEPEVSCIAKGKSHKPYEFGSKVSFAMLPKSNIIVGVKTYKGNPHDSQTLEDTLEHAIQVSKIKFVNAILDRAYRGKKMLMGINIIVPGGKEKTPYLQRKKRKKCQSRAAIEPIIGHIKHDCRMARNYLKGVIGDEINALMAASAFNMRQKLRKIKAEIKFVFNSWWFENYKTIIFAKFYSC